MSATGYVILVYIFGCCGLVFWSVSCGVGFAVSCLRVGLLIWFVLEIARLCFAVVLFGWCCYVMLSVGCVVIIGFTSDLSFQG